MIGRFHPVIIWMERMSSSSSPKKPMPTGLGIRKGRREQVTITIAPDIIDRVDERAASRHESVESVRLLRTYGDHAARMDVSRRSGLRSRLSVEVQM